MTRTLLGILMWLYWSLLFAIFFIIIAVLYIISRPFDKYREIPNYALRLLAWVAMKPVPTWHFKIKGACSSKIDQPTIVVANHQSFLDIPMLYLLPWSMKWVTKRGMRKIPVLGWIITMTGHIPIDRENFNSFRAMVQLAECVKDGIPGMVFPEGTRSRDGNVQELKRGAFKIAKKYDFYVLPVIVNGGFFAMPAGDWKFRFHNKFTISVLDPVQPSNFEDEHDLKNYVFELMQNELNQVRAEKS